MKSYKKVDFLEDLFLHELYVLHNYMFNMCFLMVKNRNSVRCISVALPLKGCLHIHLHAPESQANAQVTLFFSYQ